MTGSLISISSAVIRDAGWTLVQFIWQGFVLAVVLAVLLAVCKSASTRHNLSLMTVALMAALPFATIIFIHERAEMVVRALHIFELQWNNLPERVTNLKEISTQVIPRELFGARWLQWAVAAWFFVAVLRMVRVLGAWHQANLLRARPTSVLNTHMLGRCLELQRRIGLYRNIQFFESAYAPTPLVLGWLRPVILIPEYLVGKLSGRQLDALIIHELEHIRRFDAWSNILLVAVEAILFFHPAIWWTTGRVRLEREHCCDDTAVASCGDPVAYVEALTSLMELRPLHVSVLMAAGSLKQRARRLLAQQYSTQYVRPQLGLFGALLAAGALVLLATISTVAEYPLFIGPTEASARLVDCPTAVGHEVSCQLTWSVSEIESGLPTVYASLEHNGRHLLFLVKPTKAKSIFDQLHCSWKGDSSLALVKCVPIGLRPEPFNRGA